MIIGISKIVLPKKSMLLLYLCAKQVSRRRFVQAVIVLMLILAVSLPAWGAGGMIEITSPQVPRDGSPLEYETDFTVSGNFSLLSDDSPTGSVTNYTPCLNGSSYYMFTGDAQLTPYADDGAFGNHSYTWARVEVTVDDGYPPGGGANAWPIRTTVGNFYPFGNIYNFSRLVSISGLDAGIHTLKFTFYDVSGAYCRSGRDGSSYSKSVLGGIIREASLRFKVVKPKQCKKLDAPAGSSANVASGNLSHSQELFSVKGSGLTAGISLYYNSLEAHPLNLGPGWNHSYDIELVSLASGSMVLREADGERRLYKKGTGTSFISQPGESSSLEQSADGSYRVTFPGGMTYRFTAPGKITSLADRYGNQLAFAYENGNMATVVDSAGRVVRFNYDTANLLADITDPAGNTYSFGYADGRLASVTNPLDANVSGPPQVSQWRYSYNDKGLLAAKTDPNNNGISYLYDNLSRVVQSTDPAGNIRTFTYAVHTNSSGQVISGSKTATFVEKDQGVWTYAYDGKEELLTSRTDPNGKTTSYYYNPDRTVRARKEPSDNNSVLTTFYTYDGHGNVLTQTDPVDISTYNPAIDPQTVDIAALATLNPPIRTAIAYTYDYANFDQVASVTDYRGSAATATTYVYSTDQGDPVTTVTDPDNHISTIRYYANGTIKEMTDANGQATAYRYYPDTPENLAAGIVGLLETVTAADGVVTRYAGYDKNGNPTEIRTIGSDKRELRTVQTYDAQNRPLTVTRYAQGLPDNVTAYGYDLSGNRNYQKDPEGKETWYEYDYQGHLSKVTDAQQHVTSYSYGSTGGTSCSSCSGAGVDKLTAITDARGQSTSYRYDTLGRLVLETDPLGKKLKYTWYDSGKVKEKIDATTMPEKTLITYTYDTQGQLLGKRYADNSETTFTYDPKGRLQTAANADSGYRFTYYNNGWLKSVSDTAGRTISYDLYDNSGQKKQVTYFPGTSDQRRITYGYDPAGLGRIKTIGSAAGTFTYDYDGFGRRSSIDYPNGTQAVYGYDDLGRLTSLTHGSGGTPFLTYGYTHDQAGNRIARSGSVNETYRYDDVYRLLQTTATGRTERYGYDAVGNRTAGPGPKDTAYRYDAANRMLVGKLFGYDYDNSGNQIARIIPNAPDKNWSLTWDYENRLTKMELRKGSSEKETVAFKYDPLGRRIEKKQAVTVNGTTKTTTFSYVYDGDNVVLELMTDESGTVRTFYTHGTGTDEHLALERNGQFYYYHADGLGSITAISDQDRKVVQTYDYDSFGMAKPSTGFRNSYTYTGREWDKETGLFYYRARYYDPMEGRFLSRDPIGFEGGINLYAYVQNNPVRFTDPLGLGPLDICKCLYYGYKVEKYSEECWKEVPNDYEGQIKFISKYTTDGSLETAILNCTCQKAGPGLCAKWLASCMKGPYGIGPRPTR